MITASESESESSFQLRDRKAEHIIDITSKLPSGWDVIASENRSDPIQYYHQAAGDSKKCQGLLVDCIRFGASRAYGACAGHLAEYLFIESVGTGHRRVQRSIEEIMQRLASNPIEGSYSLLDIEKAYLSLHYLIVRYNTKPYAGTITTLFWLDGSFGPLPERFPSVMGCAISEVVRDRYEDHIIHSERTSKH